MHIHKNTATIFDADRILLLKRMQADTFFLINSYKLHLIKGGCIYHKRFQKEIESTYYISASSSPISQLDSLCTTKFPVF